MLGYTDVNMPIPLSDAQALLEGQNKIIAGRAKQNKISLIKTLQNVPAGFSGDANLTGAFDLANMGGATKGHQAGREMENVGATEMAAAVGESGSYAGANAKDNVESIFNTLGANVAGQAMKNLAGASNSLYKSAGMLADVNPWGKGSPKMKTKTQAESGPKTLSQDSITYEYVAPEGTYSQGEGTGGKTEQYSASNKFGFKEGQLEGGKGKVSILPNTGGNNEELFSSTKAGRS